MEKSKCVIREIKDAELEILEEMLYQAIYVPVGNKVLSRDIIKLPELNIYIKDFFQKKGDYCLVAEVDNIIAGAVWVRILSDEVKGYGNVDIYTPEISISVLKGYRNIGIGNELMRKIISYLKNKEYRQVSLSVSKENYAVSLYKKLGFEVICEKEEDFIMLLELI